MHDESQASPKMKSAAVLATGEVPIFQPGDRVRIANLSPVGHYRVPTYLRDKTGWIEAVIEPRGLDNEEEGYGRNAGQKLHYYRVAIPKRPSGTDDLDEEQLAVLVTRDR